MKVLMLQFHMLIVGRGCSCRSSFVAVLAASAIAFLCASVAGEKAIAIFLEAFRLFAATEWSIRRLEHTRSLLVSRGAPDECARVP